MGSRRDKLQRSESLRLIDRVVGRLRLAALGRTWASVTFGLGCVCLLMLLIRRLGGLGTDWFFVELLAGVPVCAALITVLVVREPMVLTAARRVDSSCGASDLFLTLIQLEASAGEYQPVIAEEADRMATSVVPAAVVPWNWRRPVAALSASLGVLVAASLFLPQLDPFGAVDSAVAAVAVRRDMQESRSETTSRLAELATMRSSATLTGEVDQSLAELADELRQLTVDRSSSGLKDLDIRQREIEARWRDVRTGDEVSRVLEQAQATQLLGESDQRTRQWVEELAEGQTPSINEAFDSLSSELERLDSASDGAERQQLEQQIRQAMAELQRFAGNQLQSQPMEAAMKRAMSQLDSSRLEPSLKAESVEAAKESLKLAQAELHEIANDAAQLASLERALDAIQSAKQLAQSVGTQPSGSSGKNEATIQKFVEQYADLQGDAGERQPGDDSAPSGESQGGTPGQQVASSETQSDSDAPGKADSSQPDSKANASAGSSPEHGAGRSAARENETAETSFRDSREAASLDASRRLMAMRRQGLADAGESSQEFRELVRSLQKRVSTAIEVEEIPPGYVAGIRSYFNALDQRASEDRGVPGGVRKSDAGLPASDSSEAIDDAP